MKDKSFYGEYYLQGEKLGKVVSPVKKRISRCCLTKQSSELGAGY